MVVRVDRSALIEVDTIDQEQYAQDQNHKVDSDKNALKNSLTKFHFLVK